MKMDAEQVISFEHVVLSLNQLVKLIKMFRFAGFCSFIFFSGVLFNSLQTLKNSSTDKPVTSIS